MSLKAWAEKRGFRYETVRTVVRRWWGKDRTPHGGIARQIMAALREELEEVRREEET